MSSLLIVVGLAVVGTAAGVFIGPVVGLEAPWWAWTILMVGIGNLRWGDGDTAQSLKDLHEEVEDLTRMVKGEPDPGETPEP
jgi:hypothetical protein